MNLLYKTGKSLLYILGFRYFFKEQKIFNPVVFYKRYVGRGKL